MDKNELLKKLKTLAERGEGGEKLNAKKMLDDLMKKYNISEQDISEDEIKEFEIKLTGFKSKALCSQVLFSIFGDVDDNKGLYSCIFEKKKIYFVKCTNAEFIEFQAKFKFYMFHLKKDLETFYSAFIHANEIFPPNNKVKKEENKPKMFLTDDDLNTLKLANGLEKHDYLLQIENGDGMR